jgi:alkaline phosphatase D
MSESRGDTDRGRVQQVGDLVRRGLNRRTFLGLSLSAAATWAVVEGAPAAFSDPHRERDLFRVEPGRDAALAFPVSVASGDPATHGVVLWTKVDPAAIPGGGSAEVAYEVAPEGQGFGNPVLRGVAGADPGKDWTVKVKIEHDALNPFSTYEYRFILDGTASRTGRFKTLPAPDAQVPAIRFGYVSCQDYTNGFYNAHRYLADEDLDFVVHLGDYIYESVHDGSFQNGQVRPIKLPSGRDHAEELVDYRDLYKIYKSDPDLQRLHERFSFVSIWDDHEFANDSYGAYDTDSDNEGQNFAPERRLAANQAWAEYTPTAVGFNPDGGPIGSIQLYRSLQFGDLIDLVLTDERLYRDKPPCGIGRRYVSLGCPARTSASRSMLGEEQRDWFVDQITGSSRVWKIWANEVMCMQLKLSAKFISDLFPWLPPINLYLNLDQWDGFPAERSRILAAIRDAGVQNFVGITGDLHSFGAGYLRPDFDKPDTPPVGVSLLGGSVTSGNLTEMVTFGLGGIIVPPETELTPALVGSNPHLAYFNSSTHGYVVMDVTRDSITATMKAVSTIRSQQAQLLTLRQFQVPAGQTQLITTDRGDPRLGGAEQAPR